MPDPVYPLLFGFGHSRNAEFPEEAVEEHSVKRIQIHPWQFPSPDPVHRRLVAGTPDIGEPGRVDVIALRPAETGYLVDDGGAPVHHGAEHVEGERLDCHAGTVPFRCKVLFPWLLEADVDAPGGRSGNVLVADCPAAENE